MSAPRAFDPHDPGTSEQTWLLDQRWDEVPARRPDELLTGVGHVVVLAAHPDDESLGLGGTIAAAAARGVRVTVLVASDGEGSHPHSDVDPQAIAARRREEVEQAVRRLGGGHPITLRRLGLPDSRLPDHVPALVAALEEAVGPAEGLGPAAGSSTSITEARRTLVLTQWAQDGHHDHAAVAKAAMSLLGRADLDVAHAPVWFWHWGTPDELPWERLELVDLGPEELAAKTHAVAAHRSQVLPLGPNEGGQALLGTHVLARFERVVETLVRQEPVGAAGSRPGAGQASGAADDDATAAPFDAMYETGDDPWGFQSWYELRKRALTLAALARPRYRSVVDVGCASGELTASLADRADEVVAVDVSARALEVASRRAVPEHSRISWVQGRCPEVLGRLPGAGEHDLAVLSEIGYFLTGSELLATLRAVRRLVVDGGEIALVHWRHPTREIPLDGPLVHAQARAVLGEPRVVYRDADLLLEIYGGEVR
ncbi:hypothetical protein GCM10022199_10230 [Marihabitans asiaticum]|uniref:LmbE family N-acetylglucosaminyl deacetylase n=1 Tax=Marihabitans asiaticum TaxID=415218 RepID=A0A560WH90_9MICO|nr:PIG-L family deacetylase [Marihabitans asiaticum]TWD17039.1 LmbE family N-acetylglucosaminyl deacetylase [Marihabitans asiaticum]